MSIPVAATPIRDIARNIDIVEKDNSLTVRNRINFVIPSKKNQDPRLVMTKEQKILHFLCFIILTPQQNNPTAIKKLSMVTIKVTHE